MRAAIFDLDDTLYEREQFVLSGFAAVADELERRFGLPAPWILATLKRARVRGHAGRELQALCADHGLPESLVPELVEVIRHHEPALTLGSVAAAVIAQLRADGWRVAILTNGCRRHSAPRSRRWASNRASMRSSTPSSIRPAASRRVRPSTRRWRRWACPVIARCSSATTWSTTFRAPVPPACSRSGWPDAVRAGPRTTRTLSSCSRRCRWPPVVS